MSLVSDIAASEPDDVAQVILKLRGALLGLLAATDEINAPAWHTAKRIVDDLDAGELLWPGWKKGRA